MRLPTVRDAVAAAQAAGLAPIPVQLPGTVVPGTVTDREMVHVGLDPNGAPISVAVSQRLVIAGVGDYFFGVPGPGTSVRALPGSASEPSLREGATVWQGFVSGREVLASRTELAPAAVAHRLPVRVGVQMSVAGRLVRPGRTASGPLTLQFTVANPARLPVRLTTADADPARVAPILDAIRADLARGLAPRPGVGTIPQRLTVLGPPETVVTDVPVPVRIEGVVVAPARSIRMMSIRGATASREGRNLALRFAMVLGGGQAATHRIT
ncbi:MAG: hypothetical protein ABR518_02460, partial [Actinomycetota bacterium]